MSRYKIYYSLMMIVAFGGLLYTFLTMPEKFALDPHQGTVPLTVRVEGPADYIKRANSIASAWYGCGIRVSWGDGTESAPSGLNESCPDLLQHTYYRKGIFTVKASLGTLETPAGQTQDKWTAWTTVRVE